MKFNLYLSQNETVSLEEALKFLSKRTGHSLSLNYLVSKWRQFVLNVEHGYQDSIYEYTNDLSVRDLIEELIYLMPQSLKSKVSDLMQPWDERFEKVTQKSEKPLLTPHQNHLMHNRWYRIPINLSGELAEDLRNGGFLE